MTDHREAPPPEVGAALRQLDDLIQMFSQHPDEGVQEAVVAMLRAVDVLHRGALRRLGAFLDARALLDEALADPTTEQEYLDEHRAIAERGCFGVASLVIDGSEPVFGPVVIPVPEGEEAGELWDGIKLMSTKKYFYELKRTRK